jgi:hypothetical protein
MYNRLKFLDYIEKYKHWDWTCDKVVNQM